ncbi:hypothetical protein EYC80_003120 [Monilinia laxa]|uniref:FAD-binding PCMH-type domain-containing protein n=1 Tax=Monilinia laxa TaxID=61186 RepID=A0A5N6KCR2_MONLA|nr:hypothetical protein EYC80_003120 [Monilinia laxa]
MAWMFTNNTCNPFLPDTTPCTLGNYVSYSLNATTVDDVREAVIFANLFDIRLVIRATGHDYNGKSTGAGALSIWAHHLTSISLIESYRSSAYTGRAVTLEAEVSSHQAYEFADAKDGMIVGRNCPTVALAGGYSQEGGHGPFSTKFGLAVDQVLEWKVVTGIGALVTATPTQNSGLFWALSGGGGGTYGVVLSATIKFHPAVSSISFATFQFFPPTTEKGVTAYWHTDSAGFGANVSNANTAGRLLPRSDVENSTDSFISIVQTIANNGYLVAGVTLDVNKPVVPGAPEISVNPYWRKTLMDAVYGIYFNYTDFSANFQSQNFMRETIGPVLAALTPNGAAYLNEADYQQPNWQEVFYSANYKRLNSIKAKYDPLDRSTLWVPSGVIVGQ